MFNDIIMPKIIHGSQQIMNFSKALIKHSADDFEKRSQDEITYILNTYCLDCPLYKDKRCTHSTCGCNVNGEERFLNKLAWASESCPLGHWGPGHIKIPPSG